MLYPIFGILFVALTAHAQYGMSPVNLNNTVFHCYICNSFLDAMCVDFFDNRTRLIEPCPTEKNYTMCRKIIQETYYDGSWERRYIRDCAITGDIGQEEGRWCTERLGTLRVKMRYCHCNNKHGCNGGPGFPAPSPALLALAAAAVAAAARLRSHLESEAQHLEFFKQLAREGLIDAKGGIRSLESVARLHAVMQRASKLVSKAIMLNILKYTEDAGVLAEFCHLGGWEMLNDWLNGACGEANLALEKLLLEVFLRLPVSVDMLQANNSAKLVKQIARSDGELAGAAAAVVERWLGCIKAAAAATTTSGLEATVEPARKKAKKDKKEKKRKKRERPDPGEQATSSAVAAASTVRTAPANFRDDNLLALDELVADPLGQQQRPVSGKRKLQQPQPPSPSAKSAAAKRPRLLLDSGGDDLESIHSSIEVRPVPETATAAAAPAPAQDGSQFLIDSLFGVSRQVLPKIVRKKRPPPAGAPPPGAAAGGVKVEKAEQQMPLTIAASEPPPSRPARQRPKKRVTWANYEQLEAMHYFELDPSERRATTGAGGLEEMAKREHERECEMLTRARRAAAADAGGSGDILAEAAARAIVWYKPHRIHGMPEFTVSQRSGAKSTERAKQAKRQETMLQVIYFGLPGTPASAAEPDVEHFDPEEPVVIPLESVPPKPDSETPAATTAAAAATTPGEAAPQPSGVSGTGSAVAAVVGSIADSGADSADPKPPAPSLASAAVAVSVAASSRGANGPPPPPPMSLSSPGADATQLLAVRDSAGGGISLKPEIADILRQVTSNIASAGAAPGIATVQPTTQPQPSTAASDAAPPGSNSVKEKLWNLLKSRYPNLQAQAEDLTVERIRQLLEPLREELAASGVLPQVLRALFPAGQPPPQLPAQPPLPAAEFSGPPQQPHYGGGEYEEEPPFPHLRQGRPAHFQHHHFQAFGPRHPAPPHPRYLGPGPPPGLPHQAQAPRGVCRMWFHGGRRRGSCTRGASCRYRHQL